MAGRATTGRRWHADAGAQPPDLPAARRHVAAAEALVPAAHRDCSFRMGRIWAARSELLARACILEHALYAISLALAVSAALVLTGPLR